jgi:hypothetical protein
MTSTEQLKLMYIYIYISVLVVRYIYYSVMYEKKQQNN